jgi:hypothetical protein
MDTAKLRLLALAATPGPWEQSHRKKGNGFYDTQVYCDEGETIATIAWYPRAGPGEGVTSSYRTDNAAYIAAAHPALMLRMLDVVDKAEAVASNRERIAHTSPEPLTLDVVELRSALDALEGGK